MTETGPPDLLRITGDSFRPDDLQCIHEPNLATNARVPGRGHRVVNEISQSTDSSLLEKWQPFRGPFTRWPRASDFVLALVSFFLTIAIWNSDHSDDDISMSFVAAMLFVGGNASLYWRRQKPERVHAIVLAVSALAMLFGHLLGPIFALGISLYSLGRYSDDDRMSTIGVAAAYLLILIGELAFSGLSSDDFPELILPFVFWYAGRRIRARGEYLRLLQERAEQLEREQQAEAERAVTAERTRIARELHDVVAHQVSLMTVQAGAAKTVLNSDTEAAASAINAVEVAGRRALDELRHLLGVLRPDRESGEMGPQPGRADLPQLVAEVQRAGLEVTLDLDEDQQQLPARIDLAIYRIVQEALTNVLKHAGPGTRANVRVQTGEHEVSIEVEDDGTSTSALDKSGHGIHGMRERAHLLGGTVVAGPRVGSGFSVIARLPASEEIA